MASIFKQIINGQIPAYKIREDDFFLAFLDIAPLRPGHTLVIPKIERDRFFDLPPDALAGILIFAQPIAKAIEQVCSCNRCAMSVVGLEVPHAHIHLVPINEVGDIHFPKNRTQSATEQLKEMQQKLITSLAN